MTTVQPYDKFVVYLQDGGKCVVPIITPYVGGKVAVIRTTVGNIATQIRPPAIGEKVLIMPSQNGGKIIVPLIIPYSGDITIYAYFSTFTAGEISKIRFNLKRSEGLFDPSQYYSLEYTPQWYDGSSYDGHYSSEYITTINCCSALTSYSSYETPEFYCPVEGTIMFKFGFRISSVTAIPPFPIYINNIQIRIGGNWVDFTDSQFTGSDWEGSGNNMSVDYGIDSGVGCRINFIP